MSAYGNQHECLSLSLSLCFPHSLQLAKVLVLQFLRGTDSGCLKHVQYVCVCKHVCLCAHAHTVMIKTSVTPSDWPWFFSGARWTIITQRQSLTCWHFDLCCGGCSLRPDLQCPELQFIHKNMLHHHLLLSCSLTFSHWEHLSLVWYLSIFTTVEDQQLMPE